MINVGSKKQLEVLVHLNNTSVGFMKPVPLNEWLKAKESLIEWTMGLNKNATCRGMTRRNESELYSCQGGWLTAAIINNL